MDNKTPEINPNPESIKVPESWDYPKFGEVDRIDLQNRYLETTEMGSKTTFEYLFGSDGQQAYTRNWISNLIAINKVGEITGCYTFLRIGNSRDNSAYPIIISIDFSTGRERAEYSSIAFVYHRNELQRVITGEIFSDKAGIRSPSASIDNFGSQEGNFELKTSRHENDRRFNRTLEPYILERTDKPNEVIFTREDKPEFRLEWHTEDGFLIVSEIHIETSKVKTLRAPLRLNQKEIADAIFSKPPYEKGSRGNLIIPWMNYSEPK